MSEMSAVCEGKKTFLSRLGFWGLALAAILIPTGLMAHAGAHGVVMDRMAIMITNGEARADIENMLFGDAAYDAERVKNLAGAIAEKAGEEMTKLFPEGTSHDPSLALPVIWDEWGAFEELAQELRRNARNLEVAADQQTMHGDGASQAQGADERNVQQAFEALAETCDSCHLKFREQL